MAALITGLEALGMDPERIHPESFGPARPARDRAGSRRWCGGPASPGCAGRRTGRACGHRAPPGRSRWSAGAGGSPRGLR